MPSVYFILRGSLLSISTKAELQIVLVSALAPWPIGPIFWANAASTRLDFARRKIERTRRLLACKLLKGW
jgi:hypothetical protein